MIAVATGPDLTILNARQLDKCRAVATLMPWHIPVPPKTAPASVNSACSVLSHLSRTVAENVARCSASFR